MYKKLMCMQIKIPENLLLENWINDISHRNQESIQNLGVEYLKLVYKTAIIQGKEIIVEFINMIESRIEIEKLDYKNLISLKMLRGQTFISCIDPMCEMLLKCEKYLEDVMINLNIKSSLAIILIFRWNFGGGKKWIYCYSFRL